MNKKRLIFKIVLISLATILGLMLIFGIVTLIRYQTLKDTGLPRLDVMTVDGAEIVSKEDYVDCTVSLSGAETEFCFENSVAGIRGRGNDTWLYYPKKPYRIKFEEKTSMFGETKNKSWVLLAMYNDFSLIKDRLAFGMADALDGDAFVPSYHYVELYLNGSYQGIYLLTDQVDENKGRTSVKEDFGEEDIEVPFLVELDARAPSEGEEGVDWFSVKGYSYAVKYPEADERYTDAQFAYIKNYIETVDALCRKPDVTIDELSEYLDVQSFLDFYLVQEAMGQPEINWKSVYMSKSTDGKLVMGPVWDFDWGAAGPSIGEYANQYRGDASGLRSNGNWFDALYQGSAEFRTELAERWNEVRPALLSAIQAVEAERDDLSRAAQRNHLRWHWYRIGTSFDKSFDETIEWCYDRIVWLDGAFVAPAE